MRIDLSGKNTEKVLSFERQLTDQGTQMSPNQIVNITFNAIEIASLKQIIELTINIPGDPPKKKVVKSQSAWLMRY